MKSCAMKKTGDASTIHPAAKIASVIYQVKLQIKVIPSSSKDCLAGWLENTLKVKVMAAADKGKANKAVIRIIEKSLDLPKGTVQIESGLRSTRKTIDINCEEDQIIEHKLMSLFPE